MSKRLLKGESVSQADLLFHWTGLGRTGDRVLIRLLNKQNGWEKFISWAKEDDIVRSRLEALIDLAGVPESAVERTRLIGIASGGDETLRAVALKIVRLVKNDESQGWEEAKALIFGDADLFEGALDLLEMERSASAAGFLTTLLEAPSCSREQDHLVRKALYRLRQNGIVPDEKVAREEGRATEMSPEIFVFFENRIPHWQMAFYFRAQSPFSDAGDFYILQIREGRGFEILEQHPDLSMNIPAIKKLAHHYAEEIQQKLHLQIPFHIVSPEQARYFLLRSSEFLSDSGAGIGLTDFLKFLPHKEPAQLLLPAPPEGPMPDAKAQELMNHPYFAAWMLDEERMREVLADLENIDKGPIVLLEAQTRERVHEATREAFGIFLDTRTRALLSWAFEKTAFFLNQAEPEISSLASAVSRDFSNSQIAPDGIPVALLLFERTMAYVKEINEKKEEEQKRTSLIMTPQEFQRQAQKRR